MRMARASEQDLDAAMQLCGALDALTGWRPVVPEAVARVPADSDADEPFDADDQEQCARVLEHLLEIYQLASVPRVVWGCAVMLDPRNRLVDPDSDVIEQHADSLTARRQRDALMQRLSEVLQSISTQPWAQTNPAVLAAQQALQACQDGQVPGPATDVQSLDGPVLVDRAMAREMLAFYRERRQGLQGYVSLGHAIERARELDEKIERLEAVLRRTGAAA